LKRPVYLYLLVKEVLLTPPPVSLCRFSHMHTQTRHTIHVLHKTNTQRTHTHTHITHNTYDTRNSSATLYTCRISAIKVCLFAAVAVGAQPSTPICCWIASSSNSRSIACTHSSGSFNSANSIIVLTSSSTFVIGRHDAGATIR